MASHQLDGDALAAVRHRGGHLQIIASAGSGKTEVVSQRVAELLAGPGVEVCVVGDDDQAIYQWRGSDVGNIVSFAERYPNVATFEITTNRRSRLGIIDTANAFAGTIPGRIDKTMAAHRGPSGGSDVAMWRAEDEQRETGWVAEMVLDLNERGVPYRDIAVLVRGRAAYRRLVDTFATFDIPVQPGGRTGLFDQPEAQVLGRTFAWMTDVEWRPVRGLVLWSRRAPCWMSTSRPSGSTVPPATGCAASFGSGAMPFPARTAPPTSSASCTSCSPS